jgi:hypothetical protein
MTPTVNSIVVTLNDRISQINDRNAQRNAGNVYPHSPINRKVM